MSRCTWVEFLKTVLVLISNLKTSVEVVETLVNNDSRWLWLRLTQIIKHYHGKVSFLSNLPALQPYTSTLMQIWECQDRGLNRT